MSLFFRLLAVVSTAVLLRESLALVVITAPSTVIEDNAGVETREEGATAWICANQEYESPWIAYSNIRGYLEGGNSEGKDYTDLVLYPVMEISTLGQSKLCVYLPSVDHCNPPAPNSNQVKAVKQLYKKNYFDIRFWGQASDTRVEYHRRKLVPALHSLGKQVRYSVFYTSFFSDHVREVRYDQRP